jgi:hypothetical protein
MSGVCGFGDFTQRALKSQKTIGAETNINQKTNKIMKTKLDLATKLHYELNLENFFNVSITEYQVSLLGWHTPELEKLLFDKGYQIQWNEVYKNNRFESETIVIALADKPTTI